MATSTRWISLMTVGPPVSLVPAWNSGYDLSGVKGRASPADGRATGLAGVPAVFRIDGGRHGRPPAPPRRTGHGTRRPASPGIQPYRLQDSGIFAVDDGDQVFPGTLYRQVAQALGLPDDGANRVECGAHPGRVVEPIEIAQRTRLRDRRVALHVVLDVVAQQVAQVDAVRGAREHDLLALLLVVGHPRRGDCGSVERQGTKRRRRLPAFSRSHLGRTDQLEPFDREGQEHRPRTDGGMDPVGDRGELEAHDDREVAPQALLALIIDAEPQQRTEHDIDHRDDRDELDAARRPEEKHRVHDECDRRRYCYDDRGRYAE